MSTANLPSPPPGSAGWPWIHPGGMPARVAGAPALPRMTVVTPSYNHAKFLERTIRSVLLQGYPNLEYIIVDGGSTDASVDIIRKYEPWLAHWVSEPDDGQVDAINKGLRRATGEWLAWQNSDDIYYPDALFRLARLARRRPEAGLLTGNVNLIDVDDAMLTDLKYVPATRDSLLAEGMVLTNQAAFWRSGLHARIGYLNQDYDCAFDYDWFLRLLSVTRAAHDSGTLGGFRIHSDAKSFVFQARYNSEKQSIVGDRALPRWKVRLYQARRVFLLLAGGHAAYVARAFVRRLLGVRKHVAKG